MLKSVRAGIAFTLAGCGGAIAAPLPPAPASTATAPIVLVRGGCGIGFHRGPYGGCRPNVGRFLAPAVVAPLPPPPPCPPGYARDPRPAVRLCYPI